MPEEEMKWTDVAHAQMPNYQLYSGERGTDVDDDCYAVGQWEVTAELPFHYIKILKVFSGVFRWIIPLQMSGMLGRNGRKGDGRIRGKGRIFREVDFFKVCQIWRQCVN
jgi:hypothetical protein